MSTENYPSVTHVLDKVLRDDGLDYIKRTQSELLHKKSRLGSLLHSIVHDYNSDKKIDHRLAALKDSDPEGLVYFNAYKEWKEKYVDKVLLTETRLVDHEYKYMGHPDLVVMIKGMKHPTLIDLKRVASVSQKRYELQLAAYRRMTEKLFGARMNMMFLHFHDGKMEAKQLREDPKSIHIFLYCLAIYQWLK